MTISRPSTTLVDILNPMGQTISVDATGTVNVSVPAQSAMILVPSDQVVQGI